MADNEKRFEGAARLLPPELCRAAEAMLPGYRKTAEEVRLRIGQPPTIVAGSGEVCIPGCRCVASSDLEAVLDIATQASAYASHETLRAGFFTAPGGYRIGVAGSVSLSGGEVTGFRTLSSLSIRIPHEIPGLSEGVLRETMPDGTVRSMLIISPPGAGKTTLLRDMIRAVSDGEVKKEGLRVSVADERGELAALFRGVPQMDIGRRTDVLDGCRKAEAAMMLLRTMNPQVLALDEITDPEDVAAVESAANCGVKLFATAHAEDMDDLRRRRMYMRILDGGIFEYAVFISKSGGKRSYTVRKLR